MRRSRWWSAERPRCSTKRCITAPILVSGTGSIAARNTFHATTMRRQVSRTASGTRDPEVADVRPQRVGADDLRGEKLSRLGSGEPTRQLDPEQLGL